jgi:hypothetical protein
MTGAARELDQADFDLDHFIDMFDEAMMSRDPRVIETLRKLMMIVVLTRPEIPAQGHDRRSGPLRRLYEDLNNLNSRMHRMDEELSSLKHRMYADRDTQRYGVVEEKIKWEQVAAKQMASQIDADVLKNLSRKINGGYTLSPETSIKGLK